MYFHAICFVVVKINQSIKWYVGVLVIMHTKDHHYNFCAFTLLQVRMKLDENNEIAAIKDYLASKLEANGPEPRRGKFFKRRERNARRAFREMYQRLKERSFGNRPDIPNICLLLVNEKKTSRYLKNSGIEKFCGHTVVISGEDEIDLATIRKKICPAAQIIRGLYD